MAKVSLSKQFENIIASIGEAAEMSKPKRSYNKYGHMEYKSEVHFKDHDHNRFTIYWDTEWGCVSIFRSEVEQHEGYITHWSEIFSPEFSIHCKNVDEAKEWIHSHWDRDDLAARNAKREAALEAAVSPSGPSPLPCGAGITDRTAAGATPIT